MSDWDASSDDGAAAQPAKMTSSGAGGKAGANAASSKPAPAFVGRKRFDDEDVEEDVKDDWDAEDEEPEAPDVSNLQPIKKKSTIKQKIKEREEQEKRRAELGLDSGDDVDEEEEEDPVERRRREKEAQIKADVENAANLLGTSKINADESTASLRNAKPQSKEDWEKYSNELYTTLLKSQAGRPGFDKHFVPAICRLLSEQLRDVDCRKQSTEWKKIADDKTKAEKEKKMGGGKRKTEKPKQVGTSSAKNVLDTRAYGDEALDDGDDLDFM